MPGSTWYLSAVGATLSRSLYLFLHGTLSDVRRKGAFRAMVLNLDVRS